MELTTVRQIYKKQDSFLNTQVTVGGWVRSLRDSKAFGFIVLNDGSYFETLQVVYHDTMENFAEISKLNVGAAIIVTGTLVPTPDAKQPFEIQATEITVEGTSSSDYPLQKKRHSFEYLRTISSASKNQYLSGSLSGTFFNRLCHSPVLPGKRLCLCPHSPYYRK